MSSSATSQHLLQEGNGWYLRTGQIHHFLCKCGQTDQFGSVISNEHHPSHRCSACGNTLFLDSVMFLTNESVTRWSIFNWRIEILKTEDAWIARAYAFIPLFDYALQKIRFRKVVIASTRLSFTGIHEYHEDHPMILSKYVYNHLHKAVKIKALMEPELKKALAFFVLNTPTPTIEWIRGSMLQTQSVEEDIQFFSFFLEHSHLKEADFFYWENFNVLADTSKENPTLMEMLSFILNQRKEKSLRKAIFKTYTEAMQSREKYNYKADYIFSRHITDRNHLLILININLELKHLIFKENRIYDAEMLIDFLKEHYSEKHIVTLFTGLNTTHFGHYNHEVRDTINMFRGDDATFIREDFHKVALNFQSLHNEFVRITNLRKGISKGRVKFAYYKNDLEAQGIKGDFEYRLPHTTYMLHDWAKALGNCMSSYAQLIHEGHSVIFGVFKEGKLQYAVEIRDNMIVQALGRYNKRIEIEDEVAIDLWFKECRKPYFESMETQGVQRDERLSVEMWELMNSDED